MILTNAKEVYQFPPLLFSRVVNSASNENIHEKFQISRRRVVNDEYQTSFESISLCHVICLILINKIVESIYDTT
ncbi:hypothetical protein ACTXT7_002711 [Hymenolepis weldensis]